MMERVPPGQEPVQAAPGDLILCHRKGFVSWAIRTGERIKSGRGSCVSHCAFVERYTPADGPILIEALTRGVVRTPLSFYRDIEYWIVHTGLEANDQDQAVEFAKSCVGQKYGYWTDFGIAVRFLTPGKTSFGILKDGTRICSGLGAQTQVRGWVIFPFEPSTCSPADLFNFYDKQGE